MSLLSNNAILFCCVLWNGMKYPNEVFCWWSRVCYGAKITEWSLLSWGASGIAGEAWFLLWNPLGIPCEDKIRLAGNWCYIAHCVIFPPSLKQKKSCWNDIFVSKIVLTHSEILFFNFSAFSLEFPEVFTLPRDHQNN